MNKKKIIFLLAILCCIFMFQSNVLAISTSKVSCGNITGIPSKIPEITSYIVTVIQVAVPIVLIIVGSLDLFKGITAQKDDEIKKGQKILVKRLIVAGLIFFIISISKIVISVVADTNISNMSKCIDCFISGLENCKE